MKIHILPSWIVPCFAVRQRPVLLAGRESWKFYTSHIPCSSNVSRLFKRINTARHILFAEDVLQRPSDFEVKASAVKTRKARLYKASFLLEKQHGDHQTEEAPAIQFISHVMPNRILRASMAKKTAARVTNVLVFNLKVNRGSSRHFQQSS